MISYAQNFEDVMLARAFRGKTDGFYIDVGAMDPVVHSVTRHFYELGWHGINVEPVERHFARLVEARPRDINLNLALGDRDEARDLYDVPDTGLSSLSEAAAESPGGAQAVRSKVRVTTLARVCGEYAAGQTIDFLKIDVEGWESQVIAGNDWRRFRPRIVLIEATRPNSPEPAWNDWEPQLLERDYLFVWFDGLNRFYVRAEDAALKADFIVPPNVFDDFVLWDVARLEAERDAARNEHACLSEGHMKLIDEHANLEREFARVAALGTENARLSAELDALHRSTSWRVTAPIRWLGRRLGRRPA